MGKNCDGCDRKFGILYKKHTTKNGETLCFECYEKHGQKKKQERRLEKQWIRYKKKIEEEKKEKEKVEKEKELLFQKLRNSEAFNAIKKVVKKYDCCLYEKRLKELRDESERDIKRDLLILQKLIEKKYNISIREQELVDFISCINRELAKEKDDVGFKKFKKIILMDDPSSKEDYIKSYLKNFGMNGGKKISFFRRLLNENKINHDNIMEDIKETKQMMELEGWEKSIILEQTNQIDLDLMDGYEFEKFLGNLFKKFGYKITNTKLSGDQGADLIIEKIDEKTAVQAKCYYDDVGNSAIQEVVAAKNHYHCNRALVITTSDFTKSAIELAKSNNVKLWNRKKLEEKIKEYELFDF